MLSSDFGTGQVLLAIIEITFFVIWLYLLFIVIADLFRSHDLSGWAKALWALGLIAFPYLAVLVYLIARGSKMHLHLQQAAHAQDLAATKFIQESIGTAGNPADELAKLASLKERGVIDQAEFDRLKAQVVAGDQPTV